MAERYGVKPKRFTSAWWGYFWMYYKWYTIGTILVILAIVITAVQCARKETYDLTVNYAATNYYSDSVIRAFEEAAKPYINDADGDGEANVFVQQLNFTNQPGNEEMDYTLQVKHDLELSNDYSFLYIYDSDEAEIMFNRESAELVYMNVHDWIEGSIDEADIMTTDSGESCAVKISGSKLLEDIGIDTTDLYLAVRMDYSEKDYNAVAQQSAIALANAILQK